jgi:hypothetical protein
VALPKWVYICQGPTADGSVFTVTVLDVLPAKALPNASYECAATATITEGMTFNQTVYA